MFTGLVEELGVLQSVRHGAASAQLNIAAGKITRGIKIGDSIAVNGVCLTAIKFGGQGFTADVMAETLSKTNLGNLKPGDRVNLERALSLGDRLGGHLVSGHIDGVGIIANKEIQDIAILITIKAPPEVMRYIIKKGSVAIDGTSLTIVDFTDDSFLVSLIPHTAKETTLGFKTPGDTVNLEGDIIGKYIERLLQARETLPAGKRDEKTLVSMGFLAEHGFV
ncbi:riboflavin synthase, alpha subunit [Desulfofarcimen acetoxidans DSM 771]|jgi:riboflavin synthase|uniref:Riboflavin synthase n=1 Tax=Desulfofarcimen acetoxidans (strain ATCC 49208 / DSM 771 / KCTC 5769 / VKM B-1644 / 5575) TaxID=485916 RepID=C8VZY4_DESAS|nr:riboflavin synthase [Desulfofarcimen acetoxidans]ACV63112.1 riboflavin synthase, alpha subunit [Desulfofarcimen acetoxidans DSM 771]